VVYLIFRRLDEIGGVHRQICNIHGPICDIVAWNRFEDKNVKISKVHKSGGLNFPGGVYVYKSPKILVRFDII